MATQFTPITTVSPTAVNDSGKIDEAIRLGSGLAQATAGLSGSEIHEHCPIQNAKRLPRRGQAKRNDHQPEQQLSGTDAIL